MPALPQTMPMNSAPVVHKKETYDDKTLRLKELSKVLKKFPANVRDGLSAGVFDSNGNGWQLIESFPWLAICVYAPPARQGFNAFMTIAAPAANFSD